MSETGLSFGIAGRVPSEKQIIEVAETRLLQELGLSVRRYERLRRELGEMGAVSVNLSRSSAPTGMNSYKADVPAPPVVLVMLNRRGKAGERKAARLFKSDYKGVPFKIQRP